MCSVPVEPIPTRPGQPLGGVAAARGLHLWSEPTVPPPAVRQPLRAVLVTGLASLTTPCTCIRGCAKTEFGHSRRNLRYSAPHDRPPMRERKRVAGMTCHRPSDTTGEVCGIGSARTVERQLRCDLPRGSGWTIPPGCDRRHMTESSSDQASTASGACGIPGNLSGSLRTVLPSNASLSIPTGRPGASSQSVPGSAEARERPIRR